MKMKKITGICLSLLLAASAFVPSSGGTAVKAFSRPVDALRWFKDQLNEQESVFYQALEDLYSNGELETGTASVDMTAFGITDSQIEAYLNGDTALAQAFHNAKDAFFYDYGDVFYVNPEKITLRTGRKSDGRYVMTLGKGANANYYAGGFTNKEEVAQAKYAIDSASDQILSKINDTMTDKEKLKLIHDALIEKVTYTYPVDAKAEELPYLDSVYGAMVKGAAQCGGYSKAYRYLLNAMGYDNVLVYGIRNYDGEQKAEVLKETAAVSYEEHMWNMVKLNDNWFAIDTTWDDPIDGSMRDTYFLKGSSDFDTTHLEQGVLSLNGKTFTYPSLCVDDYDNLPAETPKAEGLLVEQYKGEEAADKNLSTYKVTYNNLTEEEAGKQGLSFAYRITTNESNDIWTGWTPIAVHAAEDKGIASRLTAAEGGGYLVYTAHKGYIQFLITRAKTQSENDYFYEGDAASEELKVDISDPIEVETYVESNAKPFIRSGNPTPEATLRLKDQWIEIETDERLEVIDPDQEVSLEVTKTDKLMVSSVSNVTYEDSSYISDQGTRVLTTKVRFYFMPDKTFQSNVNIYRFTIKNMRGIYTKKEPNGVNYKTSYPMEIPCPLRKYTSPPTAKIVADPILVADDKLEAFETNGGMVTNSMHIQLVATKPDAQQQDKLDSALGNELKDVEIKKSSSYDISLSCANILASIRPGYRVMIGLPYPEGYDYRTNKDVVFKAYHFKKQADGSYAPEELICQITPAGLMVMAESFSPFTVVALNAEDVSDDNSVKTAMITLNSDGGSVLTQIHGEQASAVGIQSLKADEKKTVEVKADEGYVIEKILIDGKDVKLDADAISYTKEFSFAEMEQSTSMEVYFVSKATKSQEAASDITPLIPNAVDKEADPEPTPDPEPDPAPAPEPTPTPDPTPAPDDTVYKMQDMIDKTGKIRVVGNVEEGVVLNVKNAVDNEAKAAFQKAAGNNVLLNVFDISLSKEAAYQGSLKLTFSVDKAYEGRMITILHYINGKVESTTAQVKKGEVHAEVTSLSPFALVLQEVKTEDSVKDPGAETETPAKDQTNDSKKDRVDTGDNSVSPLLYFGAMICCVGIMIVLKKKHDISTNKK